MAEPARSDETTNGAFSFATFGKMHRRIAMKGKIISLLGVLVVVLSLTACTSMSPVEANTAFPADGKYEILGRVSISTKQSSSGYTKLLAEAQRLYPETDDIVNIMVDAKVTNFLFIFNFYKYEMTAIAVDYQ